MNINLVDPFILDILRNNGWYEGIKSAEVYEYELLIADGFALNPYAIAILEEFGGFSVNQIIDWKKYIGYHGATFEFDIYFGWNQDFLLKPFESKIGHTIFPIGRMYDAVVYVSDENKIYVGDLHNLDYIGVGIESYFNYLFKDDYPYVEIGVEGLVFED